MSNVLDRPRTSSGRDPRSRAARTMVEPAYSVWVRGAMAAGWAVVVGVAALMVVALVVWAADSKSTASAGGAMRFAVQMWLLAHRVPLRVPGGGSLTIPPMALTIAAGLLIARGAALIARSAEVTDPRAVGIIAAAVAAPYAFITTILALVTPSATFRPSIAVAFLSSIVLAGIAALIGAIRGAGVARTTWQAMPIETQGVLAGASRMATVVFGAAALLSIGSLLSNLHEFGSIAGDYNGGAGQFAMVALALLMIPNAVCFGVGYISGPGFAIGAGTTVTYTSVHLGAVPAFPLLAAVPSGPAPWQIMTLFIAAMVAAGVVAGLRIARLRELDVRGQLRTAAIAAGVFGIAVAALVGFSGGPGGPGRLHSVGPSPWQVGLATSAELAIVAMLTVIVVNATARARERVAR